MTLGTRQTRDRQDTQDDPLFGFLFAGNAKCLEAVGFKIEEPLVPPQECATALTGLSFIPQQRTTLGNWVADETFGGVIRAVVYQPNPAASAMLDELTWNTYRTTTNLSNLRRKVLGFTTLSPNWDTEGAAVVPAQTAETALQVVEQFAVVLERKNAFSFPSVRPFPDGSVFFKWICGDKELAVTVEGRNVEVQRWQPLDAFHSQGLWETTADATAEHVEWVLT